ncbi:BlaI/MecI/CopY family transcriptional regulator [Ruminococcus sp.]|uniref:BlaI/MecI/CopY family transcriptional regulator n=1 Tax=Ruminococcus sp. TaxID=41978 RepID=UPI00386F4AF8
MKSLPQISDAEFEVMNIIWKYAPTNTNDIVERLSKDKDWSPKTIQTMLFRLEKKGVITHEKESRVFVYSPLIKKEAYIELEGNTFINRFFDGALSQMVLNYLNRNELTTEEINDLQAILDKKRKK